ncbi:MAG: bis(5'-nucleosyl)-tetraphosphatase (symmetrical) YqeK [Lachnospira sp.]|nr:bis(5'-nucleosyl)-tetraphosphatase (symmetrical) YqeK [Lachnospira sp.]
MDNLYIEKLRKQVKQALKNDKMRFRHTIGVADTCACLAMRYGVDMEKAYIAGLLHDCAKCVPDAEKFQECADADILLTEIEKKNPYLIHAKLGAFYAKTKYDIQDEEICSAIQYHTTGKKNMSLLEEIVFLADYMEPYRNQADDLERIRSLAFQDIDVAVYEVLRDTLEYLKGSNRPIDTTTNDTYEYYKNKVAK